MKIILVRILIGRRKKSLKALKYSALPPSIQFDLIYESRS